MRCDNELNHFFLLFAFYASWALFDIVSMRFLSAAVLPLAIAADKAGSSTTIVIVFDPSEIKLTFYFGFCQWLLPRVRSET